MAFTLTELSDKIEAAMYLHLYLCPGNMAISHIKLFLQGEFTKTIQ